MAKYTVKVLARSWIGNTIREPGDVVDVSFEGPVPEHLEVLGAPAPVKLETRIVAPKADDLA